MNKCDIVEDLVPLLNNKKLKQMPPLWMHKMQILFKKASRDDVFLVERGYGNGQVLKITCNGYVKQVVIFSGKRPLILNDNISDFIDYLFSVGISERTIRILMFFHYGKSIKVSNNGGPFNKEHIVNHYGLYLKQANEELNNKVILKKLMNRYIAIICDCQNIDYILLMDIKKEFFYPINQLYNYFSKQRYEDVGPIHFGNLLYEPCTRNDKATNYRTYRLLWKEN